MSEWTNYERIANEATKLRSRFNKLLSCYFVCVVSPRFQILGKCESNILTTHEL